MDSFRPIADSASLARDPGTLSRFPQCDWHVHIRDAQEPLPATFRAEVRALIDDVIGEMKRDLSGGSASVPA